MARGDQEPGGAHGYPWSSITVPERHRCPGAPSPLWSSITSPELHHHPEAPSPPWGSTTSLELHHISRTLSPPRSSITSPGLHHIPRTLSHPWSSMASPELHPTPGAPPPELHHHWSSITPGAPSHSRSPIPPPELHHHWSSITPGAPSHSRSPIPPPELHHHWSSITPGAPSHPRSPIPLCPRSWDNKLAHPLRAARVLPAGRGRARRGAQARRGRKGRARHRRHVKVAARRHREGPGGHRGDTAGLRDRHGPAVRSRAGRRRPAAPALHRGGDAEAALPAAGAPDDRAVLGEVHGQAGPEAGQPGRDVLRELRGAFHRHQPVHPEPAGADTEVQVGLLGEPVRLSRTQPPPGQPGPGPPIPPEGARISSGG